tara:strand:+ start:57 stop:764 length:708 start_codon:yes stop_codon:yes gene_type:complete
MDKNQNLQYIVEDVEALWPKINRPYRFDNKEKRSVPCDATDDQAKYEIDFRMNKSQAQDLWKAMSGAYASQKEDSWPEKIKNPFKKDEEGGTFTFKSKLAAAYNGNATPAPAQYDAKNKQLDESFELTTGSTVNVAVVFVPYSIDKERTGVSLRLKGVQVTNYVPRKSISPFKAVDGFASDDSSDDNPFEEVVADTASEEEDTFEVEEPKKMSKKSAAPKEEKSEIADVLSEWDD